MDPPRLLPATFAQQLAELQARIDASNARLLEAHDRLVSNRQCLVVSDRQAVASRAMLDGERRVEE